MRLKVYIDTSVVSALIDERQPARMRLTADFWRNRYEYSFGTSNVCTDEVSEHDDEVKRKKLLEFVSGIERVAVNKECRELARQYIAAGAFSPAMHKDALHVAAATVYGYDILVSWNFRHLVNRRRKAIVQSIHAMLGYKTIEIVSPPEL